MKTQTRIAAVTLLAILCLMLAATSAMAGTLLYDNGVLNGYIDAWAINDGFTASNSFVVAPLSEITDLHFVYWEAPGSGLLTTVDMQLGSSSFGGSPQTLGSPTNTFLGTNGFGYNLYQADYQFTGIGWSGAGYLTLSNACTTSGCSTDEIFWDENDGVGCGGTHPPGGGANCPSTAYANTIGTIGSEAFSLTGTGGTTPEPGSVLLFGSGVLGLAAVLRRRFLA